MSDIFSLEPLQKALTSLARALREPKDEFVRDAVVQRFEYSYEICWLYMRRYLGLIDSPQRYQGIARKELFRFAGEFGLIDNVEAWLGYHQARNLTTHTYNESQAEAVYAVAGQFLADAQLFLDELEQRLR
jgi:nucleotidyltransferase substrate binding protein (TIGR01987 family)